MSRILVIDDVPLCRQMVAEAIKHAGHEAIAAESAIEGLDVLAKGRVDLIILDNELPHMPGLAFLRYLRESRAWKDLPVIMLTGSSDRQTIIAARRLGAAEYLLKSNLAMDTLVSRVEKWSKVNGGATVAAPPAPRATAIAAAPPVTTAASPPVPRVPAAISSDAPVATPTSAAEVEAPQVSVLDDAGPQEVLKTIKPLATRSDIEQKLNEFGELDALSPTVSRVLTLTGSTTCSMNEVAKAIKQDHAIALKIIKLANSALYTRGEGIDSVGKAVGRIGLAQIRQAVLNIAVIDRFASVAFDDHLSTPLFWEHSIGCMLIAAEVARRTGGKEAEIDAAATMGLLHDVGRMTYAKCLGETYLKVMETAKALKLPLERVETRMLLMNHADAMNRLLHVWRFPKELVNPISLHHLSVGNIRRVTPHEVTSSVIVAFSNALAHAMLLGSSGNDVIYPTQQYAEALKLPETFIGEIKGFVPEQTTDLKLALLSRSSHGAWPSMRQQVRDQLPKRFVPKFIGARPEFDAFAVFCDTIAPDEPDEDLTPTLVVHLTHVRERAEVSSLVRDAEADAAGAPYPTLLISPNGNIALEDAVMTGRRAVMLSTPLPIARFVDGVNVLSKSP